MPYFFILPLWGLVCLAGLILLVFRPTRLLGALALTTSTAAVVISFPASLLGLYLGVSMGKGLGSPTVGGVAGITGYVAGLAVGGFTGAATAAGLTFLLWRRGARPASRRR